MILTATALIVFFWEIVHPIVSWDEAEKMNRDFFTLMVEDPELAYEMTGDRPKTGRDYERFYGEGIDGFKEFASQSGLLNFESYDISGHNFYWPKQYAWIDDWSLETFGYINQESSDLNNYIQVGWAYRNKRWELDYIILKQFEGSEVIAEFTLGQY